MRHPILAVVSAIAIAGPVDMAAQPARDPDARCRQLFQATPDYDAASCFGQVTLETQWWEDGAEVFDALIAEHPRNHWLPLAYGQIYRTRDPRRAETLFRRAADAFAAANETEGELVARGNLRDLLYPLGRVGEAAREIARVVEIGETSNDPVLKARAWSVQAAHVQSSGGDLGFAYRLLKQAEGVIFPNGPYRSKRQNLNSLGQVAARMGRLDDALRLFERLDALAGEAGDLQTEAAAQYNVFNTVSVQESILPTAGGRARLLSLVERVIETATRAHHPLVLIRSHSALAELMAHAPDGRPSAIGHVERCLDLAITARQPSDEAVCSWIEASLFASTDRQRTRRAELRALDATRRAASPRSDAYSAGRHMRHSWTTKPRERALADSLAGLGAVETLRALQDDATSSADLFSTWTLDYYWLSGRLLREGRDADVALAFSITERMRARSLLDALDRTRPAPDPRHPAVIERRALLQALSIVQRDLMDPTLDASRRSVRLLDLEALERREQEARRRIALAFPDPHGSPPAFTSLETLQASLSDREAFLSFQVGLWETYDGADGGGSWLIAVTKHHATVHRLPDRTRLGVAVPLFVGLLDGRQGRERTAAVRLYQEILAEALRSLPISVTRLIVAADGPLHQLPLESLRAAPDAAAVGETFELVQTPSATLWAQWRAKTPAALTGRTLTFADPALTAQSLAEEDTRSATLLQGLRLGRLPHAREEGRAIARHVGTVDTRVGAAASEHALKATDLRAYDILHLAAHAVADDMHPERSAVLLAPGDSREDGLLQAREIEALDLEGRIVVLSACQTASGSVQSGEGVLSLARAFFGAGAHAVIGSRWPLRDADAALLFDSFYRHLSRGTTLAAALKAAQDEARRAGHPPTAWAGLVLLGNGDLRPFAGRPPAAAQPAYTTVLALTLACLAAGGGLLLQRGRQRFQQPAR